MPHKFSRRSDKDKVVANCIPCPRFAFAFLHFGGCQAFTPLCLLLHFHAPKVLPSGVFPLLTPPVAAQQPLPRSFASRLHIKRNCQLFGICFSFFAWQAPWIWVHYPAPFSSPSHLNHVNNIAMFTQVIIVIVFCRQSVANLCFGIVFPRQWSGASVCLRFCGVMRGSHIADRAYI